MGQVKRPTREQKKFLKAKGLSPDEWMVVKDTPEYLEAVSRRELAGCEMRRVEGVRKKPKTRKLYRVLMAALAAGAMLAVPQMRAYAIGEEEVRELSEQIGAGYSLCPEVLQTIAWHESRYDETAEADGCIGLMQVAERWHQDRMARLQVTDLHDPEGNMLVAADYLAELFSQYEDIGMVLMVYSGDSGADGYAVTGEGLSGYAQEIMEQASALERQHGK